MCIRGVLRFRANPEKIELKETIFADVFALNARLENALELA